MNDLVSRVQRRSLFDLTRMLPMKPSAWLVVVVELENREQVISELLDELNAAELPNRRIRVVEDKDRWIAQMLDSLLDIVILDGFEHWSEKDWQEADYLRSRLSRPGPQVWILQLNCVNDLVRFAPNLASFIGGNVFAVDPEVGLLPKAEIATRLDQYRNHYGMTDEVLVEKASTRVLAWEPELAEWLTLIGRGELIP